jgi:putative membrane protein
MWGGHWGWMGGGFFILFWVIVIVAIIFIIRWLVQQGGRHRGAGHEETALDILKKRYARGEINKDEYEQKKKDLL